MFKLKLSLESKNVSSLASFGITCTFFVFFVCLFHFLNRFILLSDKNFSFSSNVIIITQNDKKQLLYEGLFVSK